MNDTQNNQQTYTYLKANQQQRRNNNDHANDYNHDSENDNDYDNDNEHDKDTNHYNDNDEDSSNSFNRQGNHEFNMSSSSSRKRKKRKRNRVHITCIPRKGEPGGVDDPNRVGLGRNGVKWYLHFLHKGLSPHEAIKKTHERFPKPPWEKKAATFQIPESSKFQFELTNESSRQTRDCDEYCRIYQFKKNNKKLFKNLYQQQGLPLEHSIRKTIEASKKKMHQAMGMQAHLNEFVRTCIEYGFKGPSKKWLCRLVRDEGYSVEEAKNIVLKQIEETASLVGQNKNNSNRNKTDRECNALTQHSTDNISVPPISDCADLQLRVALLPKNYPQHKLGEESLHLLENAVIEEVARGWEANLQFKGINFGAGLLLVDCGNIETVQWLIFVTPQLNAWRGIDLIACLEDDLPMPHTGTMH